MRGLRQVNWKQASCLIWMKEQLCWIIFSPPGISLEETDRLCQQMEKIILANKNVEAYSRRTGMKMAFRTVPANFGDYLIQLKKERPQTTPDVIGDLRKNIQAVVPVLNISCRSIGFCR